MAANKLILDYVHDHVEHHPDKVYLTQPIGSGQVIEYTWSQTLDQARRMAEHLKSQSFEPGARIAILSKNCAHFIMAELAIWMAGGTTVAIFPTETAETIRYVLEHSGASLLFVGKLDTWQQQQSGVAVNLPCIAFPLAPPTGFTAWDAIVARTEPLEGRIARDGDDIALISYTSGSTGTPKGVMHCFARITGVMERMRTETRALYGGDKMAHRMISYLPLAHVLERALVECVSLIDGNVHVYFAESLDTFLQDLQRARPTLFASVPRLWLKFQEGVFSKMPAKKLDRLLSIPIVGYFVGRKVLKGLGLEHVMLASSASAPIPADVIAWYGRLGLNLREGYGMTEDFAYSHASYPDFTAVGSVGIPMPGVEVRISDDGEILIKSPGQMVGYYKLPDLNAEVFTPDGFFRTGHRGERDARGILKITGRVKELFKTSKGKYVSPAPIENRINASPLIEMSMVSGVGQPSAYAIVVLNEQARSMQHDPSARSQVAQELDKLLQEVNAGLPNYERLQMIVVANEPWSIENGCLTPTMKIKRGKIEDMVKGKVDHWYAGSGNVQWAA